MPRYLGLDWGEKRIGVATSDDRGVLAVGYGVWPARETEFFPLLEKTVKEEDIAEITQGSTGRAVYCNSGAARLHDSALG